MKENRGITLIALVITIIVLLILAGISIATLTGENGAIQKARRAKEETKKAEYKEELIIIGNGLQPDRVINNWKLQIYMNNYKEKIVNDPMFKAALRIGVLDKEEDQIEQDQIEQDQITIEVVVKEGWVYHVTENEVKIIEQEENPPEENPPEEKNQIYASLKGTTLTFCNNEKTAATNATKKYGEISDQEFSYLWGDGTTAPWKGEKAKIEKINFETEIKPTNMKVYFADLNNLTKIENIRKFKYGKCNRYERHVS